MFYIIYKRPGDVTLFFKMKVDKQRRYKNPKSAFNRWTPYIDKAAVYQTKTTALRAGSKIKFNNSSVRERSVHAFEIVDRAEALEYAEINKNAYGIDSSNVIVN